MIVFPGKDFLKSGNGLFHGDQFTGVSGENLGDLERLGEESLDLSRSGHRQFILLAQFIHTQNGDNILKRLIILQNLLHVTSDLVMFRSDDVRVHDTRGRIERIHGGVDSQFGDGARQHRGGVQVSEGRGRSRIGQIVSGHVDGLYGGDGSLGGRGDSFLHRTHVGGEGGLVAHGGGDTAEQGGYFGTGLSEAENVVDEEEYVLSFDVAEIFGDGEAG